LRPWVFRGTAVNVTISADNGATNVSVMAEADNLLHTRSGVCPKRRWNPGPAARYGHQQYRVFAFNPTPTGVARSRTRKRRSDDPKRKALVAQVFKLSPLVSISAGAGQ